MAVLGGGKKKTRNKNKTETITVNADGSKTVTVTKNKTSTKTRGPRRTPRPKVTGVSTLKPYGIAKQKISIPATKVSTKPIEVEAPLDMHPSSVRFRNKVKEQVAANKKEKQWQSVVRNSQPLSPSPSIPNRRSYRSRR
jgi:hypothetical protein